MINVLLCDDHSMLREGLKRLLDETADIRVVAEAADGDEALRRVSEGGIDVAVLDLTMPGTSGIELVKKIHQECPARILVLSMHKEEQYSVRALRAGASGYLTKDKAAGKLVEAIERVASGGVYMSDATAVHLVRDIGAADDRRPHELLSDREFQVFNLLVDGHTVTRIAKMLHVSSKTVSTHKARILAKMHVKSGAELVHYAIRLGLRDAGSP